MSKKKSEENEDQLVLEELLAVIRSVKELEKNKKTKKETKEGKNSKEIPVIKLEDLAISDEEEKPEDDQSLIKLYSALFESIEQKSGYITGQSAASYEYSFSTIFENPEKELRATTEYIEWSLKKNAEASVYNTKVRPDMQAERLETMIRVKRFNEASGPVSTPGFYSDIKVVKSSDINWSEIERYNILKKLSFFFALTTVKYSFQ